MNRPVLTSASNPHLRRVRRWLEKPRQCRIDRILLADGIHLVEEAFSAGLRCKELYFDASVLDDPVTPSRKGIVRLVDTADRKGATVHPVATGLFPGISPVDTPQGVLGIFTRPTGPAIDSWDDTRVDSPAASRADAPAASRTDATERRSEHPPDSDLLVAAGVQDPSNLGSMIRTARATGIRTLLSTEGTVDPFHHRALRASMGATFHLDVLCDLGNTELVDALARSGRRTLALSSRGETSLESLDPTVPSAVVFGSEGSGIAPEIESAVDLRVRIPMEPGIESLAVPAAAAVVFYWLYLERKSRSTRD